MPNSILSIAVNKLKPASLWTSVDLDDILIAGDKIYLEITEKASQSSHSYLLAKECPSSVAYKGHQLTFEQSEALYGLIFSDEVELAYVNFSKSTASSIRATT